MSPPTPSNLVRGCGDGKEGKTRLSNHGVIFTQRAWRSEAGYGIYVCPGVSKDKNICNHKQEITFFSSCLLEMYSDEYPSIK